MRNKVAVASLVVAVLGAAACGFDGASSGESPSAVPPTGGDASSTTDAFVEGATGTGDASVFPADGGDASVADSATKYSTRVTTALVALYELEENAGDTAHDSVAATAVDLKIADPAKVTWKPHALTFTDYTVASSAPAKLTKVVTACKASNELTVELWLEPKLEAEDARSRIATMATDNSNIDWAFGSSESNKIWSSVQANTNLLPAKTLTTALTHLVMTRASDQVLRVYVGGAKVTEEVTGTPSMAGWADVPLYLGNSSSNDRGWLGSVHLLAIYGKALGPAEIAQNFAAGADP